MADFRTIHCCLWDDEWIASLKDDEFRFFIYLISNRRTSASGLYHVPDRIASAESGVPLARIQKTWPVFAQAGKVFREGTLVWVKSMRKYQSTGSDSFEKGIEKDIEKIEDCELKRRYLRYFSGDETVCIPSTDRPDTVTVEENSQGRPSRVTNTDTDTIPSLSSAPDGGGVNDTKKKEAVPRADQLEVAQAYKDGYAATYNVDAEKVEVQSHEFMQIASMVRKYGKEEVIARIRRGVSGDDEWLLSHPPNLGYLLGKRWNQLAVLSSKGNGTGPPSRLPDPTTLSIQALRDQLVTWERDNAKPPEWDAYIKAARSKGLRAGQRATEWVW